MQTYNDFLTGRIKELSDGISKAAAEKEVDLAFIAGAAKEIYSYCKVIENLDNGSGITPPMRN